jgi:DNA-binding NarL/FixJ family response regulator
MQQDGAVLIADEQALCREGLTALLAHAYVGIEISQADRFSKVVRMMSDDPTISLVILDLALPDLGEISGIRMLKTRFPKVRIVVMASLSRRDSVVECLRAGVHGFIAKSLTSDEILEALETISKGRIYVPEMISDHFPEAAFLEKPRQLSARQLEVLRSLAGGRSNKEIARELGIAEGTVKIHVNALFRALGVHNRVGAAAALNKMEVTTQMSEPELPGMLRAYRRASDQSPVPNRPLIRDAAS